MVKREFERIYSALITPMDDRENILPASIYKLVEYQLESGVEGFYCCGSSGEGLLLSLDERKIILECTLDAASERVPVISHVGTIRTADAVSLARHARDAGAAAISLIPPYYYRFSMEEIVAYYEEVIRVVEELPVIVYNIPQFTGVEFSKANASALLENRGIIGIKHTSSSLYSMERMHAAYPNLVLFNGFDEQYLGALAMGATATIGTTVNCFAPLFLRVRDLFANGRMQEAQQVQNSINANVEEMCRHDIFSATKYIMHQRGIECGACRRPFKPLSDEARKMLDRLV